MGITYKLFFILSKVEKLFDKNNLMIFLNYTKEKIELDFFILYNLKHFDTLFNFNTKDLGICFNLDKRDE